MVWRRLISPVIAQLTGIVFYYAVKVQPGGVQLCKLSDIRHQHLIVEPIILFHNYFSLSGEQPEQRILLSGVQDYFDRNKISSGGDLSHYSSASLY